MFKDPSLSPQHLNINFQSGKNKKEEISHLIDSSNPAILIGTETWLNNGIHSSEIFPPNYAVIRKDRGDGYGGVLLAVHKDYIFDQLESDGTTESIFIKQQKHVTYCWITLPHTQ